MNSQPLSVAFMLRALRGWGHGVYIPEFTFGSLRVDALLVDTQHRWIRGFEIKTSRADFMRDQKWLLYSQFCSSLTIVCPTDLLTAEDVAAPFGLLWVGVSPDNAPLPLWVRRPKNLQRRNSLAWVWTYLKVLEDELPRLDAENVRLRDALARARIIADAPMLNGRP